ncbi:MAG: hypothetical protein AAF517_18845 [Planctomycetota bacterium]
MTQCLEEIEPLQLGLDLLSESRLVDLRRLLRSVLALLRALLCLLPRFGFLEDGRGETVS